MDPFETHGRKVSGDSAGKFVSIGDGPKQVPSVEGILLGRNESAKYPGNMVYLFGTKDEVLNVGGNMFLNDKVTEIGALYRIAFTGTARSKRGKDYKTFDVFEVSADTVAKEGLAKDYKSPASEPDSPADGGDDDKLPF